MFTKDHASHAKVIRATKLNGERKLETYRNNSTTHLGMGHSCTKFNVKSVIRNGEYCEICTTCNKTLKQWGAN